MKDSQVILSHKAGVPPTKEEIRQVIIQRLLDIEYAPSGGYYKNDRDGWDIDRQMLVMLAGWNNMSAEELLSKI